MEANQKLNIRGLILPEAAIGPLKKYGIYAQTAVSLEHQSVAKRYVVRGVESGGAVEETGRYVTYAGENGEKLNWLQPVDSLTVNGIHALVIAQVLTRVEIFRKGHTYELRITRHRPGPGEPRRRPELLAESVFHGHEGYLGLELWGKDKDFAGAVVPEFFTRSGEKMQVPDCFEAATRAATHAVNCVGCEHSHFLVARDAAASARLEPEESSSVLFAASQ